MNIFEFLPRPGQKKKIPGGIIFCKEWETNRSVDGIVNGTVTFEFWLDELESSKATVETLQLRDSSQKFLP